jgi:lactate permease
MAALAALLPILVILGLMLGLRWAAGQAGLAGLLTAAPIAVLGFGWGDGAAIAGVAAEAGFATLTILWIILPALLLHELQMATGATARIRAALAHLSEDPRLIALLIAWFFALFAEGAAGRSRSPRRCWWPAASIPCARSRWRWSAMRPG